MVASVAALRQPTSLPTVLTPVVGRNADLDWVLATIDEPSNHMITLTDPGGSASASRLGGPAHLDGVSGFVVRDIARHWGIIPVF
jgi:hypothetical protein